MDPKHTKYPKSVVEQPSFILVGVQKNIKQKEEVDPQTGQIGKTFQEYYESQTYNKIPNRLHPLRTYCLYYEYQNPQNWEEITYKMLVGEVVSEIGELPDGLVAVTVPDHSFCKLECGPGPIPKVVIDAWQSLCQTTPEELGGVRSHDYDFEVYPENQLDRENMTFQLYIGITK